MNTQPLKKATIPLRPRPQPGRGPAHLKGMEQHTANQLMDNHRGIQRAGGPQRALLSTTNGDVNDWIFVQRHEVPSSSPPTSSDTLSIKGVGPELTVVNIQLHDELYRSGICFSGDPRACYRRCPECQDDVAGGNKSLTRRCSVASDEHHLGPWSPLSAGQYESDVRCIGDWATSATSEAYPRLEWDF